VLLFIYDFLSSLNIYAPFVLLRFLYSLPMVIGFSLCSPDSALSETLWGRDCWRSPHTRSRLESPDWRQDPHAAGRNMEMSCGSQRKLT